MYLLIAAQPVTESGVRQTSLGPVPYSACSLSLSRALGFGERGSRVLYHSAWAVPLFYRRELTRRMPLTKLFSINCYCSFAPLYWKTRSLEIIGFLEISKDRDGSVAYVLILFNGWEGLRARTKRSKLCSL